MSFPRRTQHRLHAQQVSLSQPSGRLWMLAAGRFVQQQEEEAREKLDDLEAEREAAMQAGKHPPSAACAYHRACKQDPIFAMFVEDM